MTNWHAASDTEPEPTCESCGCTLDGDQYQAEGICDTCVLGANMTMLIESEQMHNELPRSLQLDMHNAIANLYGELLAAKEMDSHDRT